MEKGRNTGSDIGEKAPEPPIAPNKQDVRVEIGGRKGPEPTRYGDWEKDGKCVDF